MASCPQGHTLKQRSHGKKVCDLCEFSGKAALFYGCKPCDYDLCPSCLPNFGYIVSSSSSSISTSLPSATIGFENEVIMPKHPGETDQAARRRLNELLGSLFEAVLDTSIPVPDAQRYAQVELRTTRPMQVPQRRFSDEQNRIIKRVLRLIRAAGCIAPRQGAGLHAHIGYSNNSFISGEVWKFCVLFVKYEAVLDRVTPRSRRRNYRFARHSPRNAFVLLLQAGPRATIDQVKDIINPPGVNPMGLRYWKVNLQNIDNTSDAYCTVEVRCQAASTDYKKVRQWLRILLRIMQFAAVYPDTLEDPAPADLQAATEEFVQRILLFQPGEHGNQKLVNWFWQRIGELE